MQAGSACWECRSPRTSALPFYHFAQQYSEQPNSIPVFLTFPDMSGSVTSKAKALLPAGVDEKFPVWALCVPLYRQLMPCCQHTLTSDRKHSCL